MLSEQQLGEIRVALGRVWCEPDGPESDPAWLRTTARQLLAGLDTVLAENAHLATELERLRALDAAMAGAWVHGCGSGCCPDYACGLATQRNLAQAEAKRLVAEVERLREDAAVGRALREAAPFFTARYEYDVLGEDAAHVYITSCDGCPMGQGVTWSEALRAAGLMEVSDGE
jgi:hypothetical protein